MMDRVYDYNKGRWEALVAAAALFTRPWLDLDPQSARTRLEFEGLVQDVSGKHVLCLAAGGGQQSAAFALLGAEVVVLDISDGQLEKDRQAARHYGHTLGTVQGDMRDLSAFGDGSFDLVWHPYSLNFVPNCREVFKEVSRVLRPGGLYHFMAANPFAAGVGTRDWDGEGYSLRHHYIDGLELTYQDEDWVYRREPGKGEIPGPREYRQTLSSLIDGLAGHGFVVLKAKEWGLGEYDLEAAPGSWDHLVSIVPPWVKFWATYRPDVFEERGLTDGSP
jgi:SAM-dependent methyltransferase